MPFVKGYKKSWDSDDSYLRNHLLPKFGALHLDEIKQEAVISWHHGMRDKYALATCNRMVILMRYMYNLAKKWKIPGADTNPTAGVALYECNNGRERFLTIEETQKLRAALEDSENTQLRYIVPLLLLTGCRKRELMDSKWECFDIERRTWRIPTTKAGKARHVPLSAAVLSVLSQVPRLDGCPYVVPNPKTRQPYVSIFCSWNTARKAAGLPEVRMHDLRHSMASNMVNSGRSIYEVAKVLGHTQLKTSQRYSHLNQETLLAAVDASANAAGSGWGQVAGRAQVGKAGDNLVLAAV
jgi:integrase